MAKYVMALDAGTTSNRCILFNEQGEICSMAQKEFRQFFMKGYVVAAGYMGYVNGEYMLFSNEDDYREYFED